MTTADADIDAEVVVVGGRVAGAATAMLLARHGLRVFVAERSAEGADTMSTHALLRGGVVQLARWGLLDGIVAAGTPPIRRVTYVHGDEPVVVDLTPSYGVDALYAPRRTVLDPLLGRAAAEAGAVVRHRCAVTDLVRRRGRVAGVDVVGPAGTRRVRARLVVGADGVGSWVARHVGAPVYRRGRHGAAATYGYWSGLVTDGYEWVFRRTGCCGVIPTNAGEACVFVSGLPDRVAGGGVGVIREVVAAGAPALAARLERAVAPASTRTWRGIPGFFRTAHGPGWALVGDAGYFKDPISAHGITDALRDAELLARAVIEGWDGDDRGLDRALAGYQQLRDELSKDLFTVTDRIAANDWDEAEIVDLLWQANVATRAEIDVLCTLPPLDPAPSAVAQAGAQFGSRPVNAISRVSSSAPSATSRSAS